MIIRSQAGKSIVVISNTDTISTDNYGDIRAYNGSENTSIKIAEYSTKEKALKVLDMICEHYQNCEMCKCGLRQVAETEFVFQMPQDSEV